MNFTQNRQVSILESKTENEIVALDQCDSPSQYHKDVLTGQGTF